MIVFIFYFFLSSCVYVYSLSHPCLALILDVLYSCLFHFLSLSIGEPPSLIPHFLHVFLSISTSYHFILIFFLFPLLVSCFLLQYQYLLPLFLFLGLHLLFLSFFILLLRIFRGCRLLPPSLSPVNCLSTPLFPSSCSSSSSSLSFSSSLLLPSFFVSPCYFSPI